MNTERTAGGPTLELAVHGPDPGPELAELHHALTAAGVASVEEVGFRQPEPGRRVGELAEVLTLLAAGVSDLVAAVESIRQWLAVRAAAASHRPTTSSEDGVTKVVITLAGETLTLVNPTDRATSEAIAQFYERHRQD
ncbi:hypothetical protein [Streptomyces sp. NPDC050560]|uniref:hypothetical protein n=1 Tax=Streptomyces sp. NPDC050560 TaxID=3365630 RepID=UPI00379CAF32